MKIKKFLILALLVELFIFNFRHFESSNYSLVDNYKMKMNNGIIYNEDGSYTILESGDKSLEFQNIDTILENIRIDIEVLDESKQLCDISIQGTDEGNELYYNVGNRKISHTIAETQYIKMNMAGKTKNILLDLTNLVGKRIIIHNISFNVVKPLFLSKIRLVIIFFIISFVNMLRSKSQLWNIKYKDLKEYRKLITIGILLVQIVLITTVSFPKENLRVFNETLSHQYQDLSRAFINGNLTLNYKASESLLEMDNPYDTNLRVKNNVDFNWDYAYFEGKYYVYFGVAPAVLLYVPYFLITGNDLPNYYAFLVTICALIAGLMFLIHQIVKKYFYDTSVLIYVIVNLLVINGSGIMVMAFNPSLYIIPIAMGLAFTAYGLGMWILAMDMDNLKIKRRLVLVGSFFMAMVAACRPQFLIASLFVFSIWGKLIRGIFNKKSWNKQSIKEILYISIPYLFVAMLLMIYNYLRFGSPFDFGANYNLTSNDMTKRGFKLDRILLGIFTYLFQPPNIVASYPFLRPVQVTTSFMGITINECLYGGIITSNLVLILGLFCCKLKSELKEKRLYLMCILSLISAFVIVIADTQMAGILSRYISDFSLFLFLPTSIVIFMLLEKFDKSKYIIIIREITVTLCILSICYNMLLGFACSDPTYSPWDDMLYTKIGVMLQFWL